MSLLRELQIIQKKKVSLTTLVTGMVCLTILVTATILLVLSFHSKKKSLTETTLNLNSFTANKMSMSMDGIFTTMKESLHYSAETLRNYPDMTVQDVNQKLELLRNSSRFFNSIVLVEETGRVHAATPASLSRIEGTVVLTEAARSAIRLRTPYLSKPYVTSVTNRLIVSMSEPIFDQQGEFRGYLLGTIYLQEPNVISQVFGSSSIDEYGSYYYVVSSDGYLLFHPELGRVGELVSANPVVNQITQGRSGKQQVTNTRGVSQLAGYSVVPSNGWGIVVVSPKQAVDNQLQYYTKELLIYFVPSTFLLLLIAIWFSCRLTRPFVSLARKVSDYESGQSRAPSFGSYWNFEADLLAKSLGNALKHIEAHTDQLAREASIDPLTGLMNRRSLEKIMKQWVEETTAFSLLIMDIDRFKMINDTYGHQTGDAVLNHLAELLHHYLRQEDISCRYGGEEFVVLLRGTFLSDAYATAERIRLAFETTENPIGRTCTLSIGLAQYPSQAQEPSELLGLADQALYEAKRKGRNRTEVNQEGGLR
ncbi:sensor domain-containing diguanylate cyclase [Paenibacillus sp. 32352]|uniref:sensor domain-containing diguanylate cyclase n=1 Tax=Paenibacillus sp. 32352 TaxID=1969111 RepID=UPI0009AC14C3|nr:sensor domain-containing diguanylate cyclase [Paenibacillus sp. 32352]